jgi:hypothetical protein
MAEARYEQSIAIGIDLSMDRAQLRALFDEGIQRFPGYHGIYFEFLRTYSPRWGGNYADADVFVRERAYFASYACRAGDGRTYLKLRKEVAQADFSNAAPTGVSMEVCDARFLTEA